MRKLLLALPPLLLVASPADATGGLVCRTGGPRPLEVSLVLSHTAVSSVVSARLRDNGRDLPVGIAQSWIEPAEVRLDLVNRNATRHEVRLRAKRNGSAYHGTLWRLGQRRWVRCREG